MTKVLLSIAVVVGLLIAGGGARHTGTADKTTNSSSVSDLPAEQIDQSEATPSPTPAATPTGQPVVTTGSIGSAPAGASTSGASLTSPVQPDAGTGGSVAVTGETSTQPTTCEGMSHSKSTSDNGGRTRSHNSHSFCSDEPGSDCPPPSDCEDN